MNRVYKLIWSEIAGACVAISETAKTPWGCACGIQPAGRCLNPSARTPSFIGHLLFAQRPLSLAVFLAFFGSSALAANNNCSDTSTCARSPTDYGITKPGSFTSTLSGNLTTTQTIGSGVSVHVLPGSTGSVGNIRLFDVNSSGQLLLDGTTGNRISLTSGPTSSSSNVPLFSYGANTLIWADYTDITLMAPNPRGAYATVGGTAVFDNVRINQSNASTGFNPTAIVVETSNNTDLSTAIFMRGDIVMNGQFSTAFLSWRNPSGSSIGRLSVTDSHVGLFGASSSAISATAGTKSYADNNLFYAQGASAQMLLATSSGTQIYANGNTIVTDIKLGSNAANWTTYGRPVDAFGNLVSDPALYVVSTATTSYGALASGGATITLDASTAGTVSQITVLGDSGNGLSASGANSTINAKNGTQISMSGNNATGARATATGSKLNLADITIKATGYGSYGIYNDAQSTTTLSGTTNTITVGNTVSSSTASGIYANGAKSVVNINSAQTDITVLNNNQSSAYTTNGLMANIGNITAASGANLNVSVTSNGAGASRAYGIVTYNGGTMVLGGNTSVTMAGANNWGVRADGGTLSSMVLNGNLTVLNQYGTGVGAVNNAALYLNGLTNQIAVGGQSSAAGTAGLSNDLGGKVTFGAGTTTNITATGNQVYGITQTGTNTITFNGDVHVRTNGDGAHGFVIGNNSGVATTRIFDGSANSLTKLPDIVVQGTNSAVLNVWGANGAITLNNTAALTMGMTQGINNWGVKTEAGSTAMLTGNSSTGGTGLWAATGGGLTLTGNANAAGSRVKLDDSTSLNISSATNHTSGIFNGAQIGSLESSSGTTSVVLGGKTLFIGANNAGANGSLVDNANYAGAFSGTGNLVKEGALTQILSGLNNTVTSVDVTGGALSFQQGNGAAAPAQFTTTGNYTTRSGATTDLGKNNAVLNIGGAFTQEGSAILNIELGSNLLLPDITASSTQLGGTLNVTGFTPGPTPNSSSALVSNGYKLIASTNAITGNFSTILGAGGTGLDYLQISGHKENLDKEYWLGFGLSWIDQTTNATGNFTLGAGTRFTVDTVLGDNLTHVANSWNGEDLTKKGAGTLRLNAMNTYTGKTTVEEGTLLTWGINDVFKTSSHVLVNTGATLDLDGTNQTANRLGDGALGGGNISLNGGSLTVNNQTNSVADNSTFSGIIADGVTIGGSLTHTGSGTLILTGANTYTGITTNSSGTLQIGNGSASGSLLSSNMVNAGTLIVNRSDDIAYSGTISGTGGFIKQGLGVLTLSASAITSQQTSVDVQAGTLRFTQDDGSSTPTPFTTTGNYTTKANATTELGANNSVLDIGGTFTQETHSHLNVELGAFLASTGARADIKANTAYLDGDLNVMGFSAGLSPNKASTLTQNAYTLISTTGGITIGSNFSLTGAGSTGLDYLQIGGNLANGNNDYVLGFGLSWDAGATYGTGSFTMMADTDFTLDMALADKASSLTGWNGKDLTKAGDGTLILASANAYTGTTTVSGGTLTLKDLGDISTSSGVSLNNAGTALDISGITSHATTLKNLEGDAGTILKMGSGTTLTINNGSDTTFAGDFQAGDILNTSQLIKTGIAELVLSGATAWQGTTSLDGGTITLDGINDKAQLTSNVTGQAGTTLNLTRGAKLTGSVTSSSAMNIDSLSNWDVTANSVLDTLTTAGNIHFITPSGPLGVGRSLTVKNLVGGGTISLYTVFNGAQLSDKIIIDGGSATGNTHLMIKQVNTLGDMTSGDGIPIVVVEHGGTTSSDSFGLANPGGKVFGGPYSYSLNRNPDNENWYLVSSYIGGGDKPVYRAETSLYASLANQALHYGEVTVGTLQERMGSLEELTGKSGTLAWSRVIGEHQSNRANGLADKTVRASSDIGALQVGSDLWVDFTRAGRTSFGIYGVLGGSHSKVDHPDNDGHFSRAGTSTQDNWGLGGYFTYLDGNGGYLDAVLQGSRYRINTSSSNNMSLNTRGTGWVVSLEAGQRFPIATGVTLEPQGQVLFQTLQMNDASDAASGVRFDRAQSTTLRAGLRLAKTWDNNPLTQKTAWTTLNMLHSLGSDTQTRFATPSQGDIRFENALPGTRLALQTGIDGQLTKAVLVNVHLGFEHSLDKQHESALSGQIGLKVKF